MLFCGAFFASSSFAQFEIIRNASTTRLLDVAFYSADSGYMVFSSGALCFTTDGGRTIATQRQFLSALPLEFRGSRYSLTSLNSFGYNNLFIGLLIDGKPGFASSSDGGVTFLSVVSPGSTWMVDAKAFFTNRTGRAVISGMFHEFALTIDSGRSWAGYRAGYNNSPIRHAVVLPNESIFLRSDYQMFSYSLDVNWMYSEYRRKSYTQGGWAAGQLGRLPGEDDPQLPLMVGDTVFCFIQTNPETFTDSPAAIVKYQPSLNRFNRITARSKFYPGRKPVVRVAADGTLYAIDSSSTLMIGNSRDFLWDKATLPFANDTTVRWTRLFVLDSANVWLVGSGGQLLKKATSGIPDREVTAHFFAVPSGPIDRGTVSVSATGSVGDMKWFRNGELQQQWGNEWTYASARRKTDTIMLVRSLNGRSDTLSRIVNTRVPLPSVSAAFSVLIDTSSVRLNGIQSDSLTRHFWDFGNGVTDTAAVPVIKYSAVGTYLIKHIVRRSYDGFSDSASSTVTITYLQRCLDMKYLLAPTDSLTDLNYNVSIWFDKQKESRADAMEDKHFYINGQIYFGGSVNLLRYGKFQFEARARNRHTGCVSFVRDSIEIKPLNFCNPNFVAERNIYNYSGAAVFSAMQPAMGGGYKYSWKVDGRPTVSTDSIRVFGHFEDGKVIGDYFSMLLNSNGSNCAPPCGNRSFLRVLDVDSLVRTVTLIRESSVYGCKDSMTKIVRLPVLDDIELDLRADAEVPNLFLVRSTARYYSVRTDHRGIIHSSVRSVFRCPTNAPGNEAIWVYAKKRGVEWVRTTTNGCSGNLDLLEKKIKVDSISPVGIKRTFLKHIVLSDKKTVEFSDSIGLINVSALECNVIYYLGNGDSLIKPGSDFRYTYNRPGTYQVRSRFISSVTGADTSFYSTVVVQAHTSKIRVVLDSTFERTVRFEDSLTNGLAGIRYKWRFSNGDSSALALPVIQFAAPGYYWASLLTESAGGTSSFDSVAFWVANPLCDTGVALLADTFICPGSMVVLPTHVTGHKVIWEQFGSSAVKLGSYRGRVILPN